MSAILDIGAIQLDASGVSGAIGAVCTLDVGGFGFSTGGTNGSVGSAVLDAGGIAVGFGTAAAGTVGGLSLDLGEIGFGSVPVVAGTVVLGVGEIGFWTAEVKPADGMLAAIIGEIDFAAAGFADIVSADIQTWLVNLATGGHSRYTHYPFNFFFRLGSDYYGGNSTGLYRLSGDTDAGTAIAAAVTSAAIDCGRKTYVHDARVSARLTHGGLTVTTVVDEDSANALEYSLEHDGRDGLHSRRVKKMAKGKCGAVWQFVAENVSGNDFDLQSMEFTPLVTRRTA